MAKRTTNKTAQAIVVSERKAREANTDKLPIYPGVIHYPDLGAPKAGALPADYNPDTHRISKRCFEDAADYAQYISYSAAQRAAEYAAKAVDFRANPEHAKRESTKDLRAELAKLRAQLAAQNGDTE